MANVEGTKSRATESARDGTRSRVVERGASKTVTFVDCTTVVDGDICRIPNPRFCPFNIRGNNMCSECMYWKARIKARRKSEENS
jgi:hypothetical protein